MRGVCVYVRVCVCLCVCMYVLVYVCVYVCVLVFVYSMCVCEEGETGASPVAVYVSYVRE